MRALASPTTKDETSNFKEETKPDTKTSQLPKKELVEDKPAPLSLKKSSSIGSEKPRPEPTIQDLEIAETKAEESESVKSPPATKPKPDTIRESPELEEKAVVSDMPSPPVASKPEPTAKPELAPKPTTDFRNTLRSRPTSQPQTQEQPEFLSKFGSLRKAQTEKYVAPDVLRDNITRGKQGLAVTGGPQKRERKDELRDSLLAKKEQWKQEKEAGIVHERKPSEPAATSGKPEALARRELLGRKESIRRAERSPEKTRNITPEALRFQKSIREKPKVEVPTPADKPKEDLPAEPPLEASRELPEEPAPESKRSIASPPLRQAKRVASPPIQERRVASPPAAAPTSKLAARFNPGLAGILARGPPSSGPSPAGSRSESPIGAEATARSSQTPTSEPPAEGAPLADVRKGRAKGPKKRKGDAAATESKKAEVETSTQQEEPASAPDATSTSAAKPPSPPLASKPSPTTHSARFGGMSPPGPNSSASIMTASLRGIAPKPSPAGPREQIASPSSRSGAFSKPVVSPKPSIAAFESDIGSPTGPVKSLSFSKRTPSDKPATPQKDNVPEFEGFGSNFDRQPATSAEEDKENNDSSLPSVKDAASAWGAKKTYRPTESPSQIQLPTRKDEEAAMRSASLLASSPARSPSHPGSSNGLGVGSPLVSPSPAAPPKPAKSSRTVSGQLREASPNKGKGLSSYH